MFGIIAFDSHTKKADDEQEFRMSQDPEYRKFIEEKRAAEKKDKTFVLVLMAMVVIIFLGLVIWHSLRY